MARSRSVVITTPRYGYSKWKVLVAMGENVLVPSKTGSGVLFGAYNSVMADEEIMASAVLELESDHHVQTEDDRGEVLSLDRYHTAFGGSAQLPARLYVCSPFSTSAFSTDLR